MTKIFQSVAMSRFEDSGWGL